MVGAQGARPTAEPGPTHLARPVSPSWPCYPVSPPPPTSASATPCSRNVATPWSSRGGMRKSGPRFPLAAEAGTIRPEGRPGPGEPASRPAALPLVCGAPARRPLLVGQRRLPAVSAARRAWRQHWPRQASRQPAGLARAHCPSQGQPAVGRAGLGCSPTGRPRQRPVARPRPPGAGLPGVGQQRRRPLSCWRPVDQSPWVVSARRPGALAASRLPTPRRPGRPPRRSAARPRSLAWRRRQRRRPLISSASRSGSPGRGAARPMNAAAAANQARGSLPRPSGARKCFAAG